MPRSRDNGPAGDAADSISVRCPNPRCRTEYSVPARYAGRRARCAACGTLTTIPGPRAAAARTRRTKAPEPGDESTQPEVRIGCIGRGHAGKTALFRALGDGLIGDFLPSGLHLDAA